MWIGSTAGLGVVAERMERITTGAEHLRSAVLNHHGGPRERSCTRAVGRGARLVCGARARADTVEIAQRGLQLPAFDDAQVAARLTELRTAMRERVAGGWSDAEAEWFLKDRGLEVQEAADKLARYAQWRVDGFTNLSLDDPVVREEAATGKAYLRDDTDVVRGGEAE